MMKQLIPQEYCLKCQQCCCFKEANSVWAPCLLDEEIEELLDKKGLPSLSITQDRRIHAVSNPKGEGFICPFLEVSENKCKIYADRPFECQLYPFLIKLRGRRVILTLDLNCPYLKANLNTPEFKAYTDYLAVFLSSPKQIKIFKENPQILQVYEEVSEVVELKID